MPTNLFLKLRKIVSQSVTPPKRRIKMLQTTGNGKEFRKRDF